MSNTAKAQTSLRDHRLVKKLGDKALHPHIWQLNHHSFPKATFIGLWLACCPLPIQMMLAVWACVRFQAHLPTALALVWLNNPLTIAPLFYGCYRVGLWALGQPAASLEFEVSWQWFYQQLGGAVPPLLLGSVIVGTVLGFAGFAASRAWSRWQIGRRWQQRLNARACRP